MHPTRKDAYQLIHDGALVLAEIEMNGFHVSTDYCQHHSERVSAEIIQLKKDIDQDNDIRRWKKMKGQGFNPGSNQQLAWYLYDVLKQSTVEGRSVSEDTLMQMDVPFVKKLIRVRKLEKVRSTYLKALTREATNGIVHPFFNIHNVLTYRSSSDSPNFQNFPARNKELAGLVRNAIVPRDALRQMGEHDFSKLEVNIGAAYHKDPTMLKYLAHPEKYDMHRDAACWCFDLKPKLVTKEIRHIGKNKCVFPAFYGSYWKDIAEGMWHSITTSPLTVKDGTPLLEVLRDQGIKGLGTVTNDGGKERPSKNSFYKRIMEVEHRIWYDLFPGYRKWRHDWYRAYCQRGYFDTLTGFRCSAPMGRNDSVNYPIQGSAFHCLLWSLIQYHKWIRKNKLSSMLVGQIHDSMVGDYDPDELAACVQQVEIITGDELRSHWDWINTKLGIETEVAAPGKSLFEKKPYEKG